jgi:hypothetical protein
VFSQERVRPISELQARHSFKTLASVGLDCGGVDGVEQHIQPDLRMMMITDERKSGKEGKVLSSCLIVGNMHKEEDNKQHAMQKLSLSSSSVILPWHKAQSNLALSFCHSGTCRKQQSRERMLTHRRKKIYPSKSC